MRRLWLLICAVLLTACASSTPNAPATKPPPHVVVEFDATATALVRASPTLAAPTPTTAAAAALDTLNPLTGLAVADPAALNRRPLAVKIAHFPRTVRPQMGLSLADNVWEHYAEGGITRLTAIFLSQGPEKIGNVRSARLIDASLGHMYQAMLVASGTSTGVLDRLSRTDFFNRFVSEATGYYRCPLLCREEAATLSTDKLYTSAPALWQLADQLGVNGRQDLSGFVFAAPPPTGGIATPLVHLDFLVGYTVVEWRYDPARQVYARWVDTEQMPALAPHTDAATGQPITAANVVVLYAPYVTTNMLESEHGGYLSYDILLTGRGAAELFRDGQRYDLTWTRPDAAAGLPRFVDVNGQPAPFRPGAIWFEVVPPTSPTQITGGTFSLRFRGPNPFVPTTPNP